MTVDPQDRRLATVDRTQLDICGADLTIRCEPFRTLLDVKGVDPSQMAVRDAEFAFRWRIGPRWWLIDADPSTGQHLDAPLARDLRNALGPRASVVDISCQRTVVVLTGVMALNVLQHGCSIDLERVVIGHSVQGALAQTQVVIGRIGESSWRVYPRASFARHLAAWLADASAEYVVVAGEAVKTNVTRCRSPKPSMSSSTTSPAVR